MYNSCNAAFTRATCNYKNRHFAFFLSQIARVTKGAFRLDAKQREATKI